MHTAHCTSQTHTLHQKRTKHETWNRWGKIVVCSLIYSYFAFCIRFVACVLFLHDFVFCCLFCFFFLVFMFFTQHPTYKHINRSAITGWWSFITSCILCMNSRESYNKPNIIPVSYVVCMVSIVVLLLHTMNVFCWLLVVRMNSLNGNNDETMKGKFI